MQTSKLANIGIKSFKLPPNTENFSHRVDTTCGFGEVQPTLIHRMYAGDKHTESNEVMAWLAPVVAPTVSGKLTFKQVSRFVPATDIMPSFVEYLAAKRYTYGDNTAIPSSEPYMTWGHLSMYVLCGATCSIYIDTNRTGKQWFCPQPSDAAATRIINALTAEYGSADWYKYSSLSGAYHASSSVGALDLAVLLSENLRGISNLDLADIFTKTHGDFQYIPVNANNRDTLFAYLTEGSNKVPKVDIGHCDYVLTRRLTDGNGTFDIAFAFSLSAFGKRIRKMIQGAGYRINFDSRKYVSLLPLAAVWRAYYDEYSVMHWTNLQDQSWTRLMSYFLMSNDYCVHEIFSRSTPVVYWTYFVYDLGNCWYIAPQDFVSAHTINNVDSTSELDLASLGLLSNGDSATNPTVSPSQHMSNAHNLSSSDVGKNAHAAINNIVHTQLDNEVLMRIYRSTNQDGVIGQRAGMLLRARGLGEWVDSCKSNFIGSCETALIIKGCVNLAETYNPQSTDGMALGERGGQGIGYSDEKQSGNLHFHASEEGFWVTLGVVVPDVGYCQGVDPSLFGFTRETHIQPMYDGVGYELNSKDVVCGESPWSEVDPATNGTLDDSFGFIARGSAMKQKQNNQNGDFNLPSLRMNFWSYTLDKLIWLKIAHFSNSVDSSSGRQVTLGDGRLTANDLPYANTELWRNPCRWMWLAQLNRIFRDMGSNANNPLLIDGALSFAKEITYSERDNFIIQIAYHFPWFNHLLPASESYEVREEGNKGDADMSVSKA